MEQWATNITKWVGSTTSVMLHTMLFITSFALPYFGIGSFERMLLFLTTIVSLEAIYLSIFIQMSLNLNNQNIEILQEDIEEIGEDLEEIGEDIEEIQKDVDEIQEDVVEIGEDIEEIQKDVDEMQEDDEEVQDEPSDERASGKKESEILHSIQATLLHLQREIEQLKQSGKI